MADLKSSRGKTESEPRGRVLVVDDEPDIVRLLTFALQADGYQVQSAKNGSEGLERARQDKPDVVILDVMMPGMDGFEVCNELRSKPETASLPIIMLSALGQVSDRVKGLRAGADDYVPKPVNLDELSARVASLLSRSQRPAAAGTETPAKSVKVYGFVGAKGGVGTTTIALNIAALLAQQKKSVILAELRGSYGTLAAQLKWTPAENFSQLIDLLPSQIDERAVNARLFSTGFGVKILFGPQRVDEFREPTVESVKATIRQFTNMAEYVVLDIQPGASPAIEAAIRACDLVTVILEPDVTSVQAAKVSLDLLRSWGVSGSLVSATVSNRSGMTSGTNLREIKSQLGCEIIGVVPFASEACTAALSQGVPLAIWRADNIASMTLKEMASRLSASALVGIRL
jgi:DNA-binding response OmpR family regulator